MSRYYPVLLRAVGELATGSAEFRRSLYEQAQAALIAELANTRPPPSPDYIDREYRTLTSAIRRIEAEAANASGEMSAVKLSISREIILRALAKARATDRAGMRKPQGPAIDMNLVEMLPT